MPAGGREKMRYIVNSREMNLYDSRTIEEFHMPQAVLMERAAFSFVETLRREKRNTSRTLVVCGSGNNGGDGYAIARILMQAGNTVDVLEAPHTGKASVGNQLQKKIFLAYGGKILTEFPEGKSYTLVIDAVFGVGLSRSVEGEYCEFAFTLEEYRKTASGEPSKTDETGTDSKGEGKLKQGASHRGAGKDDSSHE